MDSLPEEILFVIVSHCKSENKALSLVNSVFHKLTSNYLHSVQTGNINPELCFQSHKFANGIPDALKGLLYIFAQQSSSCSINNLTIKAKVDFLSVVDSIFVPKYTSKVYWNNRYMPNEKEEPMLYCHEHIACVNDTYIYCNVMFGWGKEPTRSSIYYDKDWAILWNKYLPLSVRQTLLMGNGYPEVKAVC